jgi:glycosyltransferase involved in cell wall biosynthesis
VRVLTVTNWYPPHHFGGYELSCFDVMRGFVERGHEVRVLCSDMTVAGAPAPDPGHEALVRRELRLYHLGDALWQPSWRQRLRVERHNQAALARALDELRPDVVSAWHFGALSLGLLTTVAERGIPVVYAVCDDWLLYGCQLDAWAKLFAGSRWRRFAGRALRPVVRVPTVVADLGRTGPVLFVSEAIRRRAEAAPWRFEPTTVVFSGIDGETFAPRPEPDDRPWRWRLVTTGRPDRRKGFETVIRALALLPPETTLSHYGLGGEPERQRLMAVADELGVGDRVRFGAVERAALPAVYADADVMVFPSEWDEPFGLVPVEAMACRTPVVSTTQGGSREFLADGRNVLRFEPGDAAGLAAAVRRLHQDAGLRHRLVEAGLELAAALDVRHLVDTMEAWHIWAVTGRPVGAPPPADRAPLLPTG